MFFVRASLMFYIFNVSEHLKPNKAFYVQCFAYNKRIRCYKTTVNWSVAPEISRILGPIELESISYFVVVLLSSIWFK